MAMATYAGRMDSLPLPSGDLLDILRADNDEDDLLDFPNLEWVLEHHDNTSPVEHMPLGIPEARVSSATPQPFEFSFPAAPMLQAALQPGLKVEQQSSSSETVDVFANGRTALPASRSLPRESQPSGSGDDTEAHHQGPLKKKRTRNAEQMQQNRVAQQKYRERKKAEHEQLQNALDQLTAQLAAMKAMEAQAAALQAHNSALASTVSEQAARIQQLSVKVETQTAELVAAKKEAAAATALAASQQRMILDQHNKLQLQEEVIDALRGRLKEKMDEAFGHQDPKTVCQRMVAAVRTALEGAKNVEGLQESLAQLPDHVVTDICRSILCEVKQMWPDLAARFHSLTGGNCAVPCGQEARAC